MRCACCSATHSRVMVDMLNSRCTHQQLSRASMPARMARTLFTRHTTTGRQAGSSTVHQHTVLCCCVVTQCWLSAAAAVNLGSGPVRIAHKQTKHAVHHRHHPPPPPHTHLSSWSGRPAWLSSGSCNTYTLPNPHHPHRRGSPPPTHTVTPPPPNVTCPAGQVVLPGCHW
jgi:hypothetical protein